MAGHKVTDGRTSVNHGIAVPNADGTVTTVIAHSQLSHPNAITTLDQAADAVPETPVVDLVKIVDAPTEIS